MKKLYIIAIATVAVHISQHIVTSSPKKKSITFKHDTIESPHKKYGSTYRDSIKDVPTALRILNLKIPINALDRNITEVIKLNLQQMHNDLEHAYKEKLDHVPEQNTIKDIHESYHIVLHFLQDIALLQKTFSNLLALQINPQLIPNTNNLVKVIQYRYDLATYQYQNKQITKDMYQQIHHNYEELNKIYGIEIEEFLNSEEYQSILATRNAFKILHINPFLDPVVQGSMITRNFQKAQSDYKKNLISKENFFEIENAFYFLSSRLFIPLTPQIISEFKALLNLDKQPSLEDALNKLEKEKDNMSPLKKQTIKNFIEEKFQNQQSPATSLGSIIEPETKQLSTMPLSSMLEPKTRPASTTSLDSMLEPEAKKIFPKPTLPIEPRGGLFLPTTAEAYQILSLQPNASFRDITHAFLDDAQTYATADKSDIKKYDEVKDAYKVLAFHIYNKNPSLAFEDLGFYELVSHEQIKKQYKEYVSNRHLSKEDLYAKEVAFDFAEEYLASLGSTSNNQTN